MNTLIVFFIFVPILALILLFLNVLLSTHKPSESKISPYECGFSPIQGQTRTHFHVHFYLVAMLFLIFDLEVILLYPLAVSLYQVSSFGFSIAFVFLFVLTIGLILEIGSGVISIKTTEENSKKK